MIQVSELKSAKQTAKQWQQAASVYRAARDEADARARRYSRLLGFAYGAMIPGAAVVGLLVGYFIGG